MSDHIVTETADQGRQGETSGHMRWVLLWTLVLTITAVGLAGLAIV